MRYRAGSVLRLTAPFRVAAQRFAFLFLVLAAFFLMLLGKGESLIVEKLRVSAVDLVSPVMEVLSRPAASAAEVVENVRGLIFLREENARLREENARLLRWEAVARKLEQDNAQLRNLLNFIPERGSSFVAARVIADSGGAFARSMIVNAGRRQGIQKGQPVVTEEGLAGRIARAGHYSARMILITDLNSRIPVLVEPSRARAILAGDNSETPRLEFLPSGVAIGPGDRIVTSGHGGMFPPGLPVGRVDETAGGIVRVRPFVRLDRLNFVRVVDYKGVAVPPSDETVRTRRR